MTQNRTGSRDVLYYYVLSCLITWALISPLVLASFGLLESELSEHWHILGAVGPVTAAYLVVRRFGTGSSWLSSLRRLRVGTLWLLLATVSPPALFGLGVLIALLAGAPLSSMYELDAAGRLSPAWILGSVVSALAYGLGEEAGWRGYLLPRLQSNASALRATAVLAVLHAAWHAPMFFYRFEFSPTMLVGFFIGLAAGAVWLTCLYNATGGSALAAVLWHSSWNIVNQMGLLISDLIVATMSTTLILAAVFILVKWGPQSLAPRPVHSW